MKKISLRGGLFIALFFSCLVLGCAELYKVPATYPPGVTPTPTAQPIPQTRPSDPAFPPGAVTADKFEALAARVNTIALTIAATSPPGPVSTGAAGVAAVAGVLLGANELLKKLFGKEKPPGN